MLVRNRIPDELIDHLDYDQDTGVFHWKPDAKLGSRSDRAGLLAGYVRLSDGYVRISYKGVTYSAAAIAWKLAHGYEPELELDHINRNPSDNRLSNLRLVTRSENLLNRRGRRVRGMPLTDEQKLELWETIDHANEPMAEGTMEFATVVEQLVRKDCEVSHQEFERQLRARVLELEKKCEADAKNAARWRMLPAFLEKYQIEYVGLIRDIDAALAEQEKKG